MTQPRRPESPRIPAATAIRQLLAEVKLHRQAAAAYPAGDARREYLQGKIDGLTSAARLIRQLQAGRPLRD